MTNPLFQPYSLKGLNLPNRIVMAPMTRSFSPGGIPGDDVVEYYRKRAEGEVGLIVTEGTGIERAGAVNDPNVPDFFGAALPGWGRVADAVHGAHGHIAPQLWHVGGMPNRATTSKPVTAESPSGLYMAGRSNGDAMSDADVADAIAAFARAAADAKRLGFDAVELHGAHGYLIDQFFWGVTNQRDDGFGGETLPERGRFAAEILKAVRAAVGPDYPVIIRVSQWKQQDFGFKLAADPAALGEWLQPLADAGADMFHCSQRRFWEPEFEGSDLNFAGWVKKVTGTPTITVGSIGLDGDFIAGFGGEASQPASLDALVERLDREEFDLVAVGRALIVDPDWVQKVRDGRTGELRGFDRAALATLV
ncbi:NADH:flavin oxidoreductase [Glacieibacterium frigidum]|uniref:NADH:flavin oxidoreductase n=1 Tax=Glacieibacterium frigidum TaxID=2593303 RepID=A0A552U9A0_9SPHN|nr:NADH:flavin oxidoreductase [Glacieibacterium frigidum]TRW14759.1 NADH:flavin oxidoreductase [Glacieibacterium frigidum]